MTSHTTIKLKTNLVSISSKAVRRRDKKRILMMKLMMMRIKIKWPPKSKRCKWN